MNDGTKRIRTAAIAAMVVVLIPACGDEDGMPQSPTSPAPAAGIVDAAANGSTPYTPFYFLPPLGDGSQPSGELDATLIDHLAVEICEGGGPGCGGRIGWITAQSSGPERLRVEDDDVPHYHATWNVPSKPSRGAIYHVRVWLAGTLIGSTDVEAAGLRGTLPIKFVVRVGAAGVVDGSGGAVVAGGGAVVLSIPEGAVSEPTGFTADPVASLPEDGVVTSLAGTAFELLPAGVVFDLPVQVTVAYDEGALGPVPEANLRMFKLVDGAWVPVAGSVVDPGANTVRADLVSFSIYVLGAGTPVLDGVISATEWSAAMSIPFTANLPSGGTAAGTLYLMNDASEIYVGVHVAASVADVALTVGFDPNKNGLDSGDDAVDLYTASGKLYFRDLFTKPSCTGSCEAFDVEYTGRVDGSAAVGSTATSTTFEVAHPFTGGDAPYDILRSPGQTLCMVVDLALGNALTLVAGSTLPTPGGGCAFEVEVHGPAAAKYATSVTLAPATELHEVGTPITLSATVTAGGGTLTGNERVDFATGEMVLGTETVSATGTATLTVSSLALVAHQLTARLHPTGTLQGSTSPTVRQDMIQRFTNLAGFTGAAGFVVPGTSELQDFESGVSLPTILTNVFTVTAPFPLQVVTQCGGTTSKMLTGTEGPPDSPVRDAGLGRYQFLPDATNGRNAVAFEIHDQAAGSTPVIVDVLLVKPYSFSVPATGTPAFFGVITTAELPLEGIHVTEGLVSSGGKQVSDAICIDDFRAEQRTF